MYFYLMSVSVFALGATALVVLQTKTTDIINHLIAKPLHKSPAALGLLSPLAGAAGDSLRVLEGGTGKVE